MVTKTRRRRSGVRLLLALAFAALTLPGCGFRLVIDAVPQVDDLTETVVLEHADPEHGAGTGKVAMIDVTGLIADARSSRSLIGGGENPVGRFMESLRKAERDRDVRAIIVRINSPGGTVTASDVMYRELRHFRETTGKPVVILMGDVTASGGYYLACAGDRIVAHPTTITGSIGVIVQTLNFSEGMSRIGIHADAITSGANKALASPLEPALPEHREILQGIVNEFYDNFVMIVTENRADLATDQLDRITDGRVLTGPAALEVGLVDAIGDLRTAFGESMQLAGIGRARLVKYHRPLDHVGSAYAHAHAAADPEVNLVQLNLGTLPGHEAAGFYYLWDPTVAW